MKCLQAISKYHKNNTTNEVLIFYYMLNINIIKRINFSLNSMAWLSYIVGNLRLSDDWWINALIFRSQPLNGGIICLFISKFVTSFFTGPSLASDRSCYTTQAQGILPKLFSWWIFFDSLISRSAPMTVPESSSIAPELWGSFHEGLDSMDGLHVVWIQS